jgi:hypothetical protein
VQQDGEGGGVQIGQRVQWSPAAAARPGHHQAFRPSTPWLSYGQLAVGTNSHGLARALVCPHPWLGRPASTRIPVEEELRERWRVAGEGLCLPAARWRGDRRRRGEIKGIESVLWLFFSLENVPSWITTTLLL